MRDLFRRALDAAAPLLGQSITKAVCLIGLIGLLLMLLATQQLVMTHGYTHVGTVSGVQSVLQDDQQNSPDGLPVCELCAVSSGLYFIAPFAGQAVFVAFIAPLATIGAVSPAPTFLFPAAYLSRAPPSRLG